MSRITLYYILAMVIVALLLAIGAAVQEWISWRRETRK